MMDKSRSGREVDIHASGDRGHDDDGTAKTGGPQRVDSRATRHAQGSPYNPEDNSSEEAIYLKRQPPPEGKIGVRTDIATFYEDA